MAVPKNRKSTYENLKTKAARGEYTLVAPLDYLIMDVLPTEGTLFAGMYPLGETAANIAKKLKVGKGSMPLTSNIVTNRLRLMHEQGLVMKHNRVPGASSAVWQKTKTGNTIAKGWKGGTSDDNGS